LDGGLHGLLVLTSYSIHFYLKCPQLASIADLDEGLGPNSAAASAARAAAEAAANAKTQKVSFLRVRVNCNL